IAPQLEPDLAAQVVEYRSAEAAAFQDIGDHARAGRPVAVGLAEGELVAMDVTDDARLGDLGSRVHDAADDALGADQPPLAIERVDGAQAPALEAAIQLVEIPPGHAVLTRHDACVGAEEAGCLLGDLPRLVGLEGEDDAVLGPDPVGVVGGGHGNGPAAFGADHGQAVGAHGVEMFAAGEEGEVDAVDPGQACRRVTADGAGAVDAYLHGNPPSRPTGAARWRARPVLRSCGNVPRRPRRRSLPPPADRGRAWPSRRRRRPGSA